LPRVGGLPYLYLDCLVLAGYLIYI